MQAKTLAVTASLGYRAPAPEVLVPALYGNGCATPASLTGHGPKAGHPLTFTPDYPTGAG